MISPFGLARHLSAVALLTVVASISPHAQQAPDPHQVPVMDGEAGPCAISFTVTDIKGAPVYDARIRVHIAYGLMGVRRLDLEAATNVDGKTQFKGLPEKVKGGTLMFRAVRGKLEGSATYDPAKNCSGQQSSIVLTEN
ncbi:MAG: hypothetical protein WBE44_20380 [Terriglobales bacterium]|jgi:hypothetical protein